MRIELNIVSALGGDGSSVRPRHRAGTASLEVPTAACIFAWARIPFVDW